MLSERLLSLWLRQRAVPEPQDCGAGMIASEPDRMSGECRRPRAPQGLSVMSDESALGTAVHTQYPYRYFYQPFQKTLNTYSPTVVIDVKSAVKQMEREKRA